MKFWKLDGAGNDFILVEKRVDVKKVCDRRRGIGADGVLLVDRRRKKLAYFNADGSKAFCGNGTRSAAIWLRQVAKVSGNVVLKTDAGLLETKILGKDKAAVRMPQPAFIKTAKIAGHGVQWIKSGVPHAVVAVASVARVDVERLGKVIRWNKTFGKPGANVDFISKSKQGIQVRTFERGVEGETLACGTGAVASAFGAELLGWARLPMDVHVRSGETLKVFRADGGVWLSGPARVVFSGEL